MKKLRTGIPGMDEVMGGGIPEGQIVLLSGTCGTGKTTLCGQFLYEGLKKYKENSIYLSFEESTDSLKENFKEFGWDFTPFEKNGSFKFIKYDPYHVEEIFNILESSIIGVEAKRVVIDSIAALGLHVRDLAELRNMIFNLSMTLRKLGCTTILVSEIVPGTTGISRYGVEEFVADSVVVLYYERNNLAFTRALQVWKMRGSVHSQKLHPYKLTKEGFQVYAEEEAYIRGPEPA